MGAAHNAPEHILKGYPPTDLRGLAERELGIRECRNDPTKLRFELIPQDALEGVAKVLTFGANKYTPRNWEGGLPWLETWGSLLRHMNAFILGEDNDKETGLSHIDHVATNALMLSAMVKRRPDLDNMRLKEML